MNKNIFCIMLCLLVSFMLVACTRNTDEDRPPSRAEPLPPSSEESEPAANPVHPPIIVEVPQLPESSTEPEVVAPDGLPPLPLTIDEDELLSINSDAVAWGPGVHRDDKGRSTACLALQEKYGNYNTDFISEDEKVVSLTFDQGYENGFTPAILDALKEKDVQAIFFITGDYLRTAPELIQRMIDEGHIIGSHSDRHLNFAEADIESSVVDITNLHQAVRDQFNYEMRLFRFPEGAFSERSLELVNQMGYKSLFWSFAYKDWLPDDQMSIEDAMAKITEFLHPGEIALLHTVGETNALILPDLIDYIREQGYEIKPPDDIFG